jgi:hypothetical protein
MENLIQANSYACQFRRKDGRKWSEWKTSQWIPMLQVKQVVHPGGHIDDGPIPDDDFDVGYLKAVNWQFQNEHSHSSSNMEFRFIAVHFPVYDRFKGDRVSYVCEYLNEETVEMA